MTRGRSFSKLPLAFLTAFFAAPASAQQRDTVVVRTISAWQKDVDQLRQDLLMQRRMELEFRKVLGTLEWRLKSTEADSNRTELAAQTQLVLRQLNEASLQQFLIKRRLEALCSEVKKPEGWLGVATTGVQMLDRQVDGTKVVSFLEPPVVASVDPGSPAERVGVRAGDVLLEIGGQRLLHGSVVFSELLRPGAKVTVKLQRGSEVFTLLPTVEAAPDQPSATPCERVDAGMAYVVATPVQPMKVQFERSPDGSPKYTYVYPRSPDSTAGVMRASTGQNAVTAQGGGAMVGPMAASFFGGGANSLAGLQLMTLSTESSRAFGVTHGILVNQVLPGTPGREAGLLGGDVLVMADSQELRSINILQRVIARSADRTVTLVIVRDRKRETIQLKW